MFNYMTQTFEEPATGGTIEPRGGKLGTLIPEIGFVKHSYYFQFTPDCANLAFSSRNTRQSELISSDDKSGRGKTLSKSSPGWFIT